MLASTVAEIIIRGVNETGPAFAEAGAGLAALRAESATTAPAVGRVGTAVTGTATTLRSEFKAALAQGTDEVMRFGAVSDATKTQINETSAALARYAAATKVAGDSAVVAGEKTSIAGREFVRFGDSANIAGARLRVFDQLGLGLTGNIVLLGAAITGVSVKEFAGFQQKMQQLGANTGLTKSQVASLTQTILDMGRTTPTAVGDLADGFRHIISEGYNLHDSIIIAKAALDAADATGASFADTASTVATEMRNWGHGASQAAQDTGALLVAAQSGNTTLQGLVSAMGKVGPTAAAIHMPLSDAVSLIAELTRATGDPSLAQTYAEGMLTHIISPTKTAVKVMGELKQATGIDLLQAFHEFSVGQITFSTLMRETQMATHGNAQEIMALFGGIRGGIGVLQLMHGGLAGYIDISAKAKQGTAELAAEADRAHNNLSYKLGTSVNNVKVELIDFGSVINATADDLGKMTDRLHELPGPLQGLADFSTLLINPMHFASDMTAAFGGSVVKLSGSIKEQLTQLEKMQKALEDEGHSANDGSIAGLKLNVILKAEAALHDQAADKAEKHAAALYRLSHAMLDEHVPLAVLTGIPAGAKQPVPTKFGSQDIAAEIAKATANVTVAQNKLAYDEINKHTKFLAADRVELEKALTVQKEWDDALGKNTATVKTHTTSLDALQKVQADLTKVTALAYADLAGPGKKITAEHAARIEEDTKKIAAMTDAVTDLTEVVKKAKVKGPTSAQDASAGNALTSIFGTTITDMIKGMIASAKLPPTFSDKEKAAQAEAAAAADLVAQKMYDLQHHIADNLPPLSELEKYAKSTAAAAKSMGDAATAAAAEIAKIKAPPPPTASNPAYFGNEGADCSCCHPGGEQYNHRQHLASERQQRPSVPKRLALATRGAHGPGCELAGRRRQFQRRDEPARAASPHQ